jgi:hypothetical protein
MMRELIAPSVIDPTLTGKKMRLASWSKIKNNERKFFFICIPRRRRPSSKKENEE